MKLYKVLDTKLNREFKPNLVGYAFEGVQSGEYTILNINADEKVTILSEGIEILEDENLMSKSKLHKDFKYECMTETKKGYRILCGLEYMYNFSNEKVLRCNHVIIYNYNTKKVVYETNSNLRVNWLENEYQIGLISWSNEIAYLIDKYIDNKYNFNKMMDRIFYELNQNLIRTTTKEMINNYIEEQKQIKHEQLRKENKKLEQELNKLVRERNLYLLDDTIMAVIDFKDKRCNKLDGNYIHDLLTKKENKEKLQNYTDSCEIHVYFMYDEDNCSLQGHNDNLKNAIKHIENNIIIKHNKIDKLIIDKIKPRVIEYFVKELNIYDENIIDNEIDNIVKVSKDIRNKLKYKGGIYYSVNELFKDVKLDNEYYKYFIMDALKMQDIEFYNNEEYRVCS